MSKKEKKKKVEVKQSTETAIAPRYPSDIFQTFDEMWGNFRRDFLRPWRPLNFWEIPLMTREIPEMLARREACTDLVDAGKEFKVCAEVPGIPKDKLDITITKDGIEISGRAETERKEEEKGYVLRERGYSEVYKRIAFPEEVIPDKAVANLTDGLLEIKVPKKAPTPEAKKHKIEIK